MLYNDPEYIDHSETEEVTPPSRWQRLTGPFASAIIHAILLVILAFTVSAVKHLQEEEDVVAFEMKELPPPDLLDHLPEPEDEPFDEPAGDSLDDLLGDLALDLPQIPLADSGAQTDVPQVTTPLPTLSPTLHPNRALLLPNVFGGRNADGRMATLQRYRVGHQGEAMVEKALNWLHRNQIKSGPKAGTWPTSPTEGAAMAGFGLLTFLAHGELPTSKDYGETVSLAIDYLIRTQSEDGQWKEKGRHTYGHAIATMAVAEAYAMTKHPSLQYAMDRGVERIITGTILTKSPVRGSMRPVRPYDTSQSTDSKVTCAFWNYDYVDGAWANASSGDGHPRYAAGVRKDHSFMGFQIQALKAASYAKCKHPKLAETLRAAENGVKFMQSPKNHSFIYQSLVDTPAKANEAGNQNQLGVGTYCLGLVQRGIKADPEFQRAAAAIRATPFDPSASRTFYRMYYKSYASVMADSGGSGPTFDHYYPVMLKWLAANQRPDGSWSHEAAGQSDAHGLVYGTCLGALSLMAPYRYIYGPNAAPATPTSRSDVQVRIQGGDFNLQ